MTAWHDARMSQPQMCFVLRAPTNSGQYDRFYSNYVYGVTYKHRSEQRGAEIRRNLTETRRYQAAQTPPVAPPMWASNGRAGSSSVTQHAATQIHDSRFIHAAIRGTQQFDGRTLTSPELGAQNQHERVTNSA